MSKRGQYITPEDLPATFFPGTTTIKSIQSDISRSSRLVSPRYLHKIIYSLREITIEKGYIKAVSPTTTNTETAEVGTGANTASWTPV